MLKNESEYLILFKADKDVKYKKYLTFIDIIKNEIKSLRNEHALKTHNIVYKNLLESQKKELNTIYPENFYDWNK